MADRNSILAAYRREVSRLRAEVHEALRRTGLFDQEWIAEHFGEICSLCKGEGLNGLGGRPIECPYCGRAGK
jgi:hypothetical protein